MDTLVAPLNDTATQTVVWMHHRKADDETPARFEAKASDRASADVPVLGMLPADEAGDPLRRIEFERCLAQMGLQVRGWLWNGMRWPTVAGR